TRDVGAEDAIAKGVATFTVVPEIVHREELLELDHRTDRCDVAADARDIGCNIETLSGMPALRIIDAAIREVRNPLARDDALQGVRSGEVADCDRLEERL